MSLGEASISLPPIRSPQPPAQAAPLLPEICPPSSPPPPAAAAEEPFDPTALIEVGEYEYDPDWYAQDEENEGPPSQHLPARAVSAQSAKPAKPLRRKPKKRVKQLQSSRNRRASNVTAPMPTLPQITGPGLKSAAAVVAAAQKLKAAPAKKKMKDYSNKCRDMRGKSYDLKKLRAKKQKAIMKGMKFMTEFLRCLSSSLCTWSHNLRVDAAKTSMLRCTKWATTQLASFLRFGTRHRCA